MGVLQEAPDEVSDQWPMTKGNMMKSSRIRYYVVDAFTNRPFKGNPAAVVTLEQWKDDFWLQNVAMEMHLSETAFLVPTAQGFDLRWFTPTTPAVAGTP
jgi:PhzF family phenazine biosynthesis protein